MLAVGPFKQKIASESKCSPYWPPFTDISFMITRFLLFVHKTFYWAASSLSELLQSHFPSKSLRSADQFLLGSFPNIEDETISLKLWNKTG